MPAGAPSGATEALPHHVGCGERHRLTGKKWDLEVMSSAFGNKDCRKVDVSPERKEVAFFQGGPVADLVFCTDTDLSSLSSNPLQVPPQLRFPTALDYGLFSFEPECTNSENRGPT